LGHIAYHFFIFYLLISAVWTTTTGIGLNGVYLKNYEPYVRVGVKFEIKLFKILYDSF
tara:strand:- start:450 stop:623 length:174 start_codon:yes stop_codon:yes gene_type:complete